MNCTSLVLYGQRYYLWYGKVILLLCMVQCIHSSDISITVDPQATTANCEQGEISDFVLCTDLDSAISYVTSLSSGSTGADNASSSVSIVIFNGIHYVTTQTNFGDTNVNFVGRDQNVMVVCEYSADMEIQSSALIHTWFFNESGNIGMENIHFSNCGFPFRFFAVSQVNIKYCTFMNFSEAVLDIYNCHNVTLDHISLHNNSGNGRLQESVRGNSGGVAFGYNMLPIQYINPSLTVSNSIFMNNRALRFLAPEEAETNKVFFGRGGGMALYMNESNQDIHVEITDCIYKGNFARLFGGGIYFVSNSYETTQHVVEINRCQFSDNVGRSGGAGVQVFFLSSGDVMRPHSFILRDCSFERNIGESGGGMYASVDNDGNLVRLERCNFSANGGIGIQDDLGAALAFSDDTVRFSQRVTSIRHEVVNCSFVNTSGPNGVLSIGYIPVSFSGSNHFTGNEGASLRIVGSLVDFQGEIEFRNNNANNEGVLYLLSFGQMRIHEGTHFLFDGNYGTLGASIVVDTLASLLLFNDLIFNPRCFILYENSTATPQEWKDVGITFTRNEATISSAVYLSQRGDMCSWFKQTPPFFNSTHIPNWPLWSYEANENTGYLDSQYQPLSFGTAAQEFSLQSRNVSAWPGQKTTLSLIALDGFSHQTSSSTNLIFQPSPDQDISRETLGFSPQILVLSGSGDKHLLKTTFIFSYSLNSPKMDIREGELGRVMTDEAFNPYSVVSDNFTLYSLPCPGGYGITTSPTSNSSICTCTTIIKEIVFCEEDQDSVILKYGVWASYNPTNLSKVNLYFNHCPAGYCSCTFNSTLVQNSTFTHKRCIYQYKHSDPDNQCVCEREGILCGQCRNGAGISVLLNKCVSCSDGFLALIPLLVIIVAIVLVAIILFDHPLPDWMIPFIFYIQSAPYATQFFPETFNLVGKYLYYLSSVTSFYFIYDFCLSSNLSMTYSHLLRYLPALIAVVVFSLIWLIRRRILKKKTLRNHGCWWCLLLMYSSVAHTSMSALHCTAVPFNGSVDSRWFVSGETVCFSGAHAFLGLLAIFMLLVCVFVTILVTVLPSMKRSLFKNYKIPFSVNFNENFHFWSGIELARRFIFLLALIPFPQSTVYAILVLVISISLYAYNFPYKSKVANIIEIVIQLNFLVLLLLEQTPLVRETVFIFSRDTSGDECDSTFSNVSYIVFLLAPIYYAPVLLLVMVPIIYLTTYIKRCDIKLKHKTVAVTEESEYAEVRSNSYTTQTLDIDYSQSLEVIDRKNTE